MKIVGFLAIVFGAAFYLTACSSMEVPREEAYGNQLPKDFSAAEFASLNTDIALAQVMDSIKTINAEWEQGKKDAGEATSSINAAKRSDNTTFLASDIVKNIAINYLQWSDELITAMRAEAATGSRKDYLQRFNIFDRDDELEFIQNFTIDSTTIAKTYLLYGKKDGRAYRACKAGEKITLKTPDLDLVVTSVSSSGTKYYDYSAYSSFCADTESGKPYQVYVIP